MRKLTIVLAFISMMSLGSCMAGPMLAVEAIDDMVVDVVPERDGSSETPEFNFPFVGDLHKVDWEWQMIFPWTWFGIGTN